jgi:hypothetical protein
LEPADETGNRYDEAIFVNFEKLLTSNPDSFAANQTTGCDHVGYYQLDLPTVLPGEAGGNAEISPLRDCVRLS